MRQAVHHIGSLVDVLHQLKKALLSDEDLVGLEEGHDIERVAIVPLYLIVVLLRANEVWTGLLAGNDAHESSLVGHVMLVDLVD